MKNGDAIIKAAKVLAKELGIGLREEKECLMDAADKVIASYKDGTLSENVKQSVEKNAAIAGEFLSNQMCVIEKELQKAKEQVEKRHQSKEENVENAVKAEEVEPLEMDNTESEEEPSKEMVSAEETADENAAVLNAEEN